MNTILPSDRFCSHSNHRDINKKNFPSTLSHVNTSYLAEICPSLGNGALILEAAGVQQFNQSEPLEILIREFAALV